MASIPVYNPLDKLNLGKSIVEALLEQTALSFESLEAFSGAGVYAIYYHGDFPAYRPLKILNTPEMSVPIYVGKAIPKGGRTGIGNDHSLESNALFRRLTEHKNSIETVDSLRIEDFKWRCLVVDDIWIGLGEGLLIQRFRPLWNQVVDGFGNHDPGAGRYSGKRPAWDELHPGRAWAERCKAPKSSKKEILVAIECYFIENVPVAGGML